MSAGCASTKKPTPSGFLNDYSEVATTEESRGELLYVNPDKSIKDYKKIIIEPVAIHFHEDAKGEDIDPAELNQLVQYAEETLNKAFAEKFEIVKEPGDGVAILRTAITDVKPNRVYLNLHWSTTLLGAGVGGADLEAEFRDSKSDERLMAVLNSQKGNRAKYLKGLSKWGHTKEVLDGWAKMLAKKAEGQ